MKPQYKFFANFAYARAGLAEIWGSEKSFRIEVCIFVPAFLTLFWFKFNLAFNIAIVLCMGLVLALECVNSAIERAVDLTTSEFHPLAKTAKDAGSAAVMIANFMLAGLWCWALADSFGAGL